MHDLVDGGCSLREWRYEMSLCTFASCFDLQTHAWFEPTTDQQQSFSIRVRSSRPATNAHLLETQGPRDEILPTKNVASRADFDAASSTEVFAALGSQLEHVDGISWSLRDLSSCRSRLHVPNAPPSVVEARPNRNAIGGSQEQQRGDYRRVGGRNRHFLC